MKNQSVVIIIGLGVLVVGAIAYSALGTKSSENNMGMNMPMNNQMDMGGMDMGEMDMGGMDMGEMDNSMMMVKSEREFLEGMIPHHQEAVDSAKEVIARGGSTPEIKKLASDIIVAQEKEIAMMKGWYKDWYKEAYVPNPAKDKPMMRDLSKLSGAALDKVFLEDMIVHHKGALMMAQSVQPYIENQEITDLAKAIMETQTAEMTLMEKLLSTLK